ncbi:MAG: hypothetical protein LBJ33_22585 [Pseudomonas putida]|jgi:hypothetical protein|uniref:TnsA endonuclease N terminal n=1 Tax=Pseudomonas guariconensis TaxID=1288410 RepID=A0AAX0VSN7_9PSED|nr:hypothetical protein [Pseudomonas guariconensis]MDR0211933.1 hypothetical protein [Pseudomonas putida]PLV14723.1 hypothetical protein CXG49_22665 [Pseudomonas guariconensis]PLV25366.1 hypothetical protein CXG53_06280 [Pseudomonas guariconensis]PLV30086.1 hypothetical protein CXG51_08290 [Pseudomonas guariconensis]
MSKKSAKQATPSNALIAQMRNRGSVRSSIWHVYSLKANNDLILESHREVAHWLVYLEFDSSIVSFWKPRGDEFNADQRGGRKVKLDAIATNAEGLIEWHEVKSGYIDDLEAHEQLKVQKELARAAGALYRLFDESTRSARHYEVIPLLRLANFVALTRWSADINTTEALLFQLIGRNGTGTIGSLAQMLPNLDMTELVGGLSRLAIKGQVKLTIDAFTPNLQTTWSCKVERP